ncbi:MAG: hypothetical protein Ct9H300mP12_17390 [Acidimicrobiales bacterium]|nr:MAG: hypothetical protein Ct9H300mP12_17390 [Acidimicrobiales bacterium]
MVLAKISPVRYRIIPPPARHSECRIGVDPSQLTDEGIEAGVHPTRIDPPAALKELHVDDLQSGALLERIVLDEATHDVRFCEQGDPGSAAAPATRS